MTAPEAINRLRSSSQNTTWLCYWESFVPTYSVWKSEGTGSALCDDRENWGGSGVSVLWLLGGWGWGVIN